MNPSAAQILEAVEALGGDEVVVLPNNRNIVLTAEQAAGMSERPVEVVPTTLDAGRAGGHGRLRSRSRTPSATRRAWRTRSTGCAAPRSRFAVRDSEIDGVAVAEGQVLGLVDGRLVASGDDLRRCSRRSWPKFAAGDAEVVTVLTSLNGSDVTVADSQRSPSPRAPRLRSSSATADSRCIRSW